LLESFQVQNQRRKSWNKITFVIFYHLQDSSKIILLAQLRQSFRKIWSFFLFKKYKLVSKKYRKSKNSKRFQQKRFLQQSKNNIHYLQIIRQYHSFSAH